MRILALNVGTGLVQSAVFDAWRMAPLTRTTQVPYELDHPTPEATQVPAERLWSAVTTAARQASGQVQGIEAIGLTGAATALVLLDHQDRPLAPIWTDQDRQSRPAARQVWAAVGEEFLRTTGNRPLPGTISVLCYRQQLTWNPYLARHLRSYLHVNGWLGLQLTGERACDRGTAGFTGLFDTITTQNWSQRWCDFFEVDTSWLPPVVGADAIVGTVRTAVAGMLGVAPGLPVKIGTTDLQSAILATLMRPGDLLHTVGATQVLAGLTEQPRPDARHLTSLLGVGGGFVQSTRNPVGGDFLGWMHSLCFREQSEAEFLQDTVPLALRRTSRVTLDPPYLAEDCLEIETRRAAFRDLTLATERLDLLAAGLQEMHRQHEKAIEGLGLGARPGRIFMTGARADVVRRLIPEYESARVEIVEEAALRGVMRLFSNLETLEPTRTGQSSGEMAKEG